jgi:hypothetical protein
MTTRLAARCTLATVAIIASSALVAAAAGPYSVIDLGVAQGANAINGNNLVAGRVSAGGGQHACLWQIDSSGRVTFRDLHDDIVTVPTLAASKNSTAYGLNDSGQFAGWADNGLVSSECALLGTPAAGGGYAVVDLRAAFPSGANPFRRAYDVNNTGILVG